MSRSVLWLSSTFLAASAAAQCTNPWLPGPALPAVDNFVRAQARWDPDGAGPRGEVLVVAGFFTGAGGAIANRIATYDLASGTWSPLGLGMNGLVQALAVLQNGDLIAAGTFTQADGAPANRIARWGGTGWSPLGSGFDDDAIALAVRPNGDLIASGFFTTAGGAPAERIARWNGLAWSPLGAGLDDLARALVVLPSGDLVAGGLFTTAGGIPAAGLARWNGSTWSSFGFAAGSEVSSLHRLPGGDLLAGGAFTPPGGTASSNARWNGSSWTAVPYGGRAFATLPNGDFAFAVGTQVLAWSGLQSTPLGTGMDNDIEALLTLPDGSLCAGGRFLQASGQDTPYLARWNGAAWQSLGPATDRLLAATGLVARGDGSVIAAGTFRTAANQVVQRVARWDGASWQALGGDANGELRALVQLPGGDLVVGGTFSQLGSAVALRLGRWDGSSWQSLGGGVQLEVNALAVAGNGDLFVGGNLLQAGNVAVNGVARWNGSAWSAVGSGLSATVQRLAVVGNGDLVAIGPFGAANVARWNGSSWALLGTGVWLGFPRAIGSLPNGDLVVGGPMQVLDSSVHRIARWTGANWVDLGGGVAGPIPTSVDAITSLPDGDLLVAGRFASAGGVPAANVARWTGSGWLPLGLGLDRGAQAVATAPNGDVVLAGDFSRAGGQISSRLARLTTSCPASVVTSGFGCSGSGGVNQLTAVTLPWLGATARSRATGMPANGVAVSVIGFGTVAIALPNLLPQAGAGCALLASPDVLGTVPVLGGVAELALAIPDHPSLVGAIVHQQVVAFELAAQGIVAVTATNRLSLQKGRF